MYLGICRSEAYSDRYFKIQLDQLKPTKKIIIDK